MASVSAGEVRGVVIPTGRMIEGLACPPGQALFLGRSLAERQERALLGGGARPGPDDPRLHRVALPDDVALLPAAVRAVLELGRKEGRAVALRPSGELARFLDECTLGRRGALIAYLPPGVPAEQATLDGLPEVELPTQERLLDMPVHRTQFGADLIQVPVSDQLLFPVDHWLQLLWANLLGLGPFLWRELVGRTVPQVVFNIAWAWLGCWSANPYRIAAQLRKRGRGCRIHPSAVVEGCWLGDAVEIGANAVVRGCVLGDGARVEELAVVDFSVLGRQAFVQRQAMVRFSVLERGGACAGQMQLGVLGADAALKHGATLMDINFAQGVRVRAAGALHPAPLGIAGVCVGPRAIVGSGLKVAAGRAVPPDLVVLPPAASILARIPEPCEKGRYQVVDGTLERA
ncbi:MAG: hypothetical protein ABIO70_22930 [Pseudomonadota bacterium]